MSSVEYTDDFVRASIAQLEDRLPGIIDDVNAAYGAAAGDAMFLVPPAAISDGTDLPDESPWLQVTIGEDELGPDPQTGEWVIGAGISTAAFGLVVYVHMEDPVPGPQLHTKLKRYAHAITKAMLDPGAFPTYAPTIRKVRRVWRLNEDVQDELSSFAYLRFEFEMDVQI